MSRSAKRFFIALLLGSMLAVSVVLFKLGPAIVLSAVLAVMLWRWQEWLSKKLRGRRQIAAGLLVFGVTSLLVTPVILMSAFVVREATDGAKFVMDTVESDGAEGLVDRLPGSLRSFGHSVLKKIPVEEKLEEAVNTQGGTAAAAAAGAISATGSMLLQIALMLIALFFFLVEGRACVDWLDAASPLRKGQTHELLTEVKTMAKSVVSSTFITAGVQAAAAVAGFFIARVPHPLFFGAVTFFCAVIPAVGAAVVVVAAAGLLFLTGHPYWALFLSVWGVVVVGLVDNLVKPLLIKGKAELNGAVVFFSLVGGIMAFGALGLLVGPLVVTLFLALLRMYHRDVAKTRRDMSAVGPVKNAPHDTTPVGARAHRRRPAAAHD